MRRFFRSVALLIAVAALASCAAHATYGVTCDLAFVYPLVRLVYPVSGTGGVAPRGGIVIYASFANGKPGPLSVPIALQVDSRTQAQVQTTPTALPSPLPSPAAAPSGGSAQLFAVAVPRLDPDRTYDVLATVHFGGCGPTTTGQDKIGSFRTRQRAPAP
jgi:predicted small lipoprotein YifL